MKQKSRQIVFTFATGCLSATDGQLSRCDALICDDIDNCWWFQVLQNPHAYLFLYYCLFALDFSALETSSAKADAARDIAEKMFNLNSSVELIK